MSLEIIKDGKPIAKVSKALEVHNETRLYHTDDNAQTVLIKMGGRNAEKPNRRIVEFQILGPTGENIGTELRIAGLNRLGNGSTAKVDRGGDGKEPVIKIKQKKDSTGKPHGIKPVAKVPRPYEEIIYDN